MTYPVHCTVLRAWLLESLLEGLLPQVSHLHCPEASTIPPSGTAGDPSAQTKYWLDPGLCPSSDSTQSFQA